MNKLEKLLLWLGFDIVIDEHPYGDLRVVQRGKKQILQKFIDGNYAMDGHWKDVKEVQI